MTTTPAGPVPPQPPTLGEWQPLTNAGAVAQSPEPMTRIQKILVGTVAAAVLVIATLGFIGSYTAVTKLAAAKGFGSFADAFPIAVDAGIIAFLALDLLLTWRRIPYPLLRQTAWGLTAATIAFNAVAAWPDPVGVGMHSVIPILFVIAVEAARHAVGRIADITADKHIESPPLSRWFLNPLNTFVIWRRMRLWNIRSYETVIDLERQTRIYRAQLRKEHGRRWRRKATADQLLVLDLVADGMSVEDAIDLPQQEAKRRAEAEAKRDAEAKAKAEAEAEAKHAATLRQTEVEAKRRAELAEAAAAEAEAKRRAEVAAEAARLEVEAKRRQAVEAARLAEAETEAKLEAIARQRRQAEAEAELKQREQQNRARELERQQRTQRAEAEAEEARRREQAAAQERARRIQAEARITSPSLRTGANTSGPTSDSTSASAPEAVAIGGQRSKREAEVEKVLARLLEADNPKAVSLEDVMRDFDLKQTTAYDRLKSAQALFEQAKRAATTRSA
ncbi:DUF2637 domain-containing protein [Streptomyces sp. NPDC056069]|uniref:DUF2637 domain-containing protein n=1 Tax=Streptomyces sp. NPDC056069 TaxID=3345702 RepID=UPI0035DCF053